MDIIRLVVACKHRFCSDGNAGQPKALESPDKAEGPEGPPPRREEEEERKTYRARVRRDGSVSMVGRAYSSVLVTLHEPDMERWEQGFMQEYSAA